MNSNKICLKKYLYFIVLFLTTSFLYSQKEVKQVFSLEYEIDTAKSKLYNYPSYKKLILSINDSLSALNQKGFINSEISSLERIDEFSYKVKIRKNHKPEFITIDSLSTLPDYIKDYLALKVNDKNQIKFDNAEIILGEISDLISKKGFPFAKVKFNQLKKISSNVIRSNLSINYGKRRSLDKIKIVGYESFRKKYLKKIFEIDENTPLDMDKLYSKTNEINETGITRIVKTPELLFTRDSTTLYLYLEKIKKNSFDGYIGFDSDDDSGKLNIQGYVKAYLLNNFNYGESLQFEFRNENSEERSLEANLSIPYIFNLPINSKYGINIIQKDSAFNSYQNFLDLNFKIGKLTTGTVMELNKSDSEFSNENIKPFRSNVFSLFTTFQKNDINDQFIPNDIMLSFKYGYGNKVQQGVKSNLNKIKFELIKKHNISSKFKINTRFIFEKIKSNEMVLNELLRFGGVNTIRGFDENSIYANEFKVFNSSFNYYLNDTIYIYTIFDLANFDNEIMNLSDSLYSGGFGFSSLTGNGIISLNYSKGSLIGQKFNLKNAKISINFTTFF